MYQDLSIVNANVIMVDLVCRSVGLSVCGSVSQKNVKNCRKSVKTCHIREVGLSISICLSVGQKMSKSVITCQ